MGPGVRRSSWRVAALVFWLISAEKAWASPETGVTWTGAERAHANPSVHRALSLLNATSFVPIEVIDVGKLPRQARRIAEQTCAYIRNGVQRISSTRRARSTRPLETACSTR